MIIKKPEKSDFKPRFDVKFNIKNSLNLKRSESMKSFISQPINILGDFQGFADAFLEDICGYYTPFIQVKL